VYPKVDDFVKSKHGLPVGIVISVGRIRFGSRWIMGVEIDKGGGRIDFIPLDHTIILNRNGWPVNEPATAWETYKHSAEAIQGQLGLNGGPWHFTMKMGAVIVTHDDSDIRHVMTPEDFIGYLDDLADDENGG
jgi:hypothetical protein